MLFLYTQIPSGACGRSRVSRTPGSGHEGKVRNQSQGQTLVTGNSCWSCCMSSVMLSMSDFLSKRNFSFHSYVKTNLLRRILVH